MFGTFQKEEEEVVYGVTKPLNTWNAFWANVDYYKDLWDTVKAARGWKDKLAVLVKPPGWRPSYLGGPLQVQEIDPMTAEVFDTTVSNRVNYYVLFHFIILLVYTSLFLFMFEDYSLIMRGVTSIMILATVINMGRILENRPGFLLELARILVLFVSLFYLPMEGPVVWIMATMVLASFIWAVFLRAELKRNTQSYAHTI